MSRKGIGKIVKQTSEATLPPVPAQAADGKIQVIQGNTPVITVQILAAINTNIMELCKKMDELIGLAKQ